MGDVWKWGQQVGGNCWRTTGDIGDSWGSMSGIGFGQNGHERYAGPGHWNDPDYILIGAIDDPAKWNQQQTPVLVSLTADEQYSYMSMWALMASPLFFGGDMGALDDFTLGILNNSEVIDVDQDALGWQGRVVRPVSYTHLEDAHRPISLGLRLPGARRMLFYASLALVPALLFCLMLLLARR